MREIKFRAWDKFDGEMLTPGQSEIFRLMMLVEQGVKEKDRFILMQYTGLKDKNGKEIYEGDICQQSFTGYEKGQVSISPTQGVMVGLRPIWPANVEVIGNIYENPELLKTL